MRTRTVLRRLASLVAVSALLVGGIVSQGTPAYADYDYGDGNVYCNSGEICFYGDEDYFLVKQFWYGANHHSVPGRWGHGPYYWFDTWDWEESNTLVMDNAIEIRNRDTACRVWVWNVDGSGNWYPYMSQANGSGRLSVYEMNNGHTRCSGSNAPITL